MAETQSREEVIQRAKQIDSLSMALVNLGVTVVKRHPIPVRTIIFLPTCFMCLSLLSSLYNSKL